MDEQWEPSPIVGWTESDGPGQVPPATPRLVGAAAAASLCVAVIGFLTSTSVCPEHALWIDVSASLAVVLAITAIVATVKASTLGPPLALGASVLGASVAAIGLVHEVTRARVVVSAFAAAGLLSAYGAMRSWAMRRWEARVLADAIAPIEVPVMAERQDLSPAEAAVESASLGNEAPLRQ